MRRHHWAILVAVLVALGVWLLRARKTSEPLKAPRVRTEEMEHSALRKRAEVRRHTDEKRRRDELAAKIQQPAEQPQPAKELDADYIQGRIKDLLPLLKECSDQARRDTPDLAGRLVLHFDIVADPALGGVVESLEIERADGGANHPALEQCVRATVETQIFAPLGKGGRASVTYPFVLSP